MGLTCFCRSLGHNPTEEELTSIIGKADLDGDGKMEFGEFVAYASKLMAESDNEASLRESFKVRCQHLFFHHLSCRRS